MVHVRERTDSKVYFEIRISSLKNLSETQFVTEDKWEHRLQPAIP